MDDHFVNGVSIRKLRRVFGKTPAVDSISFNFECGHVHGFIGPNGAGKTTTMRMLSTIDIPDGGNALIMGHSIVESPYQVRRHIGFVPDWFTGFASTTVHEYLDFFARTCNISGEKRIRTVGGIEEFTGLIPFRDKLVSELSRGMQQRVTLGRALVNNPDVLLMDEPAANLDPRARIELRELVKILAGQGKAVLISSHILPELAEMCDSVTIIDRGRILASGSIDDIKHTLKPHRTFRLQAACDPVIVERALQETPHIFRIAASGDAFQFDSDGDDLQIAAILRDLTMRNIPVFDFHPVDEGLEDIFMTITDQAENDSNRKDSK